MKSFGDLKSSHYSVNVSLGDSNKRLLCGLLSAEKRNMHQSKDHESVHVEDNTPRPRRLSPMWWCGGHRLATGRMQV